MQDSSIPRQPLQEAPYGVVHDNAPRDLHGHRDLTAYGRRVVGEALAEAGIELGAYDERIAEWLGQFDAVTALTVASWIVRATEAGRDTI